MCAYATYALAPLNEERIKALGGGKFPDEP